MPTSGPASIWMQSGLGQNLEWPSPVVKRLG
jgi:hypothetical protein